MRALLFFLFYLGLITSTVAVDRVVGASSLYPTIGAAMEESVDGDRILVETGVYTDQVVIDRSISILPLAEGGRYTLTTTVWLGSISGGTVHIQGMRALNGIGRYSVPVSPVRLQIVDSYLAGINLFDPNYHASFMRDTIATSIGMYPGEVIGCVFLGTSNVGAGLAVITNSDPGGSGTRVSSHPT